MEGFGSQPLVGRVGDIQNVIASLRSPTRRGALVVGDAGVGKSAVAHAAVAELAGEFRVFTVQASAALSAVPRGALAPLLPHLDTADTGSALAMMRALLELFRPKDAADLPALLLVDDAHELDEGSGDMLAQLVASAQVRLLIVSRSGIGLPAGLLDHAVHGMLSRHYLGPLTEELVHQLCVEVLGGPVLASTSAELARTSACNPLFVLALLAHGRRNGTLVERHGVWLMLDRILPPDGRLMDLIKVQFSALPTPAREALEIVALAEPVPLSVMFSLGLHEAVDTLSAGRFITIGGDANRLIRPWHPLYGEAARRLVPAARSARLHRMVLPLLPDTGPTAEGVLRRVGWSLDCGVPVPDAELVGAAYAANNLFETELALRAAAMVRGPEWKVAARVQSARAHYHLGDSGQASELLKGAMEQAGELVTLKSTALLMAELQLQAGGSAQDLAATAASWHRGIDRLEAAGAAPEAGLASARRGARLLSLYSEVAAGRYGESELRLQDTADAARAAGDAETTMLALVLLGEVLLSTGRVESAVEQTRQALGLMLENKHRFLVYYEFILRRHFMALVRAGRWDQMSSEIHEYLNTSQRSLIHLGGTVEFAYGVVHLLQGRWPEAADKFAVAVEGLKSHDLEGLLPLALGMCSFSAAAAGRTGLADEALAAFGSVTKTGTQQFWLLSQGYVAAAKMLVTEEPEHLQQLRALVDMADMAGMTAAEVDLRSLAVRLGDLSGVKRLLKLTDAFEGAEAASMNAFARAVVDHDAAELIRIAQRDRDGGYFSLAGQSLQEAQRLAKASGDRALIQQVQRLLSARDGAAQSAERMPASPRLTKREHRIATLVVQGRRNSEIAAELSVSVRTVEGHIYRIFEKLGINRRDELSAEHLHH